MGMTTRGAWIRDATETDALECGAAHHAIAFEPRVDRETPRVGGGRHGAFVCVPCARESRGAWTGRTRQRQWTGRAPARVSFEFCRVREPETALSPLPDRRHYFPLSPRARTEFFFCAFSFVASRYKASRSPVSRPPRASRLLEPSARFPSVPRSQPATGDRVVRPGVSSKRSSREVPARRPTAKARRAARPSRGCKEKGSEALRRSER